MKLIDYGKVESYVDSLDSLISELNYLGGCEEVDNLVYEVDMQVGEMISDICNDCSTLDTSDYAYDLAVKISKVVDYIDLDTLNGEVTYEILCSVQDILINLSSDIEEYFVGIDL